MEKLVAMGILKKNQGDGTYVQEYDAGLLVNQMQSELILNPCDVVAILEFREIVEPACVYFFIERSGEAQIKELDGLLEIMERHQADPDGAAFYEADCAFHLKIAAGSGNPLLARMMELLNGEMNRYHYTASKTIGARTGVEEHRHILNAIHQKDQELACLFMKRHIQRSKRDMEAYMSEQT